MKILSRSTTVILALSIIYALTMSTAARAQAVAIAQVSGNVTDQSGSAIPNAQVDMTEIDKQALHTAMTNSQGQYVLPGLPVGPYRMEVKANGFKDYVQTGIVLQVNQNIQINAVLQVGSISEKVEVSAVASMVETKE